MGRIITLVLPQTFQKYEEYSTKYIIDIHSLNEYIHEISEQANINPNIWIDVWIKEHCYTIIRSSCADNLSQIINQNLTIAKQSNDHNYVEFISQKLQIVIDQDNWTYTPNKIKLQIKPKTLGNFTISEPLAKLLSIPQNRVFKYEIDIIMLIHEYIYENHLQNQYNRNVINPDNGLLSILSPLTESESDYTYYTLHNHVIQHIKILELSSVSSC